MDDEPRDADELVNLPIDGLLDLHAFNPRDVASVVEEYVRAAHAAGLREIRIVHGRGRGVQRGIVQATLERHPLVASFRDDFDSHLGATVAQLTAGSGLRAKGSGPDLAEG
ncbi:MAG: Smr/MutS family protein [Bacteroidales bacterium]